MGYPDKTTLQGRATVDAADVQIATAPWKARRRYIPVRMMATNENAAASLVKIYDKDAAVGSPPARGDNASAALMEFYVPATSTVFISELQMPIEFFHAGITVNATKTPLHVMIDVKED